MEFRSERLKYRYFTKQDFQLYYSVFSNEQVMTYAWIDKFENEDEAKPYFEHYIGDVHNSDKKYGYAFAVFSLEDNSFIGFASIEIHSRNSLGGCGELGYFLLPEYWGKGYATELAKAVTGFGFEKLKLHKVSACCNSNNLKSEEIMKKVGMTKEGELRKVRFKYGRWDDEKQYGILVDEWAKAN